MTPLPLNDFLVIDLTAHRAGPTAVRQLADWGAQVALVLWDRAGVAQPRAHRRGPMGAHLTARGADLHAMNRAIALHRLRPVIDRTFPFAETRHPEMSGAAPPRRKVIPEKPTMSASRAARVSRPPPLPPIRMGG